VNELIKQEEDTIKREEDECETQLKSLAFEKTVFLFLIDLLYTS
jgi:hypothetical protein